MRDGMERGGEGRGKDGWDEGRLGYNWYEVGMEEQNEERWVTDKTDALSFTPSSEAALQTHYERTDSAGTQQSFTSVITSVTVKILTFLFSPLPEPARRRSHDHRVRWGRGRCSPYEMTP
ncbi:hypothetical protein E2C01_084663 [Portunus trituberculatus]|uniref:Uncharacterized protein n=1 Tax=Portunus trituberculatus TaxID=210409 RepID=A0A5B7J6V1_PORTR|nr:hypothetical protein [Portunus trituberculatus]